MTPLRKRMLEDLQIRNYSPNTVAAYIRRVAEFAKHFGKSPELLGPEEIREYQLYLIKDKTVSLSAYIQTVCGLRFLYSNTLHRSVSIDRIPLPRYEKKLPVILSPAEVQRLLAAPKNLSHRSNPGCACYRDPERLHGPHLYITYREDDKSRSLYVPPEHAQTARRARQAWAAFWEIGCSLAKFNRDRLHKQWQHEKQSRTPSASRSNSHD